MMPGTGGAHQKGTTAAEGVASHSDDAKMEKGQPDMTEHHHVRSNTMDDGGPAFVEMDPSERYGRVCDCSCVYVCVCIHTYVFGMDVCGISV